MKNTPDNFFTPYQRLLFKNAVKSLQEMLDYDEKKSGERLSKENTLKEIKDLLNETNDARPNQILSESDINALLRTSRNERENDTRDRLNKSEYKSKEFYDRLDEIDEKEYAWRRKD